MDELEFEILQRDLSRRELLRLAGAGAAAFALSGASALDAFGASEAVDPEAIYKKIKSKKLVFANYGGTTQKAREVAFLDSFSAKTGVEVVSVDANPALGSRQMEGLAKPTYDAFHDAADAIFAYLKAKQNGDAKTILPPLPAGVKQNDLMDARVRNRAWHTFFVGHAMAYMEGTFKNGGPKNWRDFFDTKKFPGKRGWPGPGFTDGTIEAALVADGVNPKKLFPLDFKRGNAKLRTIKSDMLFYTEFPQVQQFLTSKSVAVAMAPGGILYALQRLGAPVTIVLNQNIVSANCMDTPPGALHADAAYALADWTADPKRQAIFSTLTHYGPGNKDAFKHMDRETARSIPNSPAVNPVYKDAKIAGDQFEDYNKANEEFFKD
jgi:putative spermidine/putrescine transport system substrate-binding protein